MGNMENFTSVETCGEGGGGFPAGVTPMEPIAVPHLALVQWKGTVESPLTVPITVHRPMRFVQSKKWPMKSL